MIDNFSTWAAQLHAAPPEFVLWWLVVALTLLGAAATAVTIWSNLRTRPPHETPTRREFDELSKKVTRIETDLPQMERRLLDALETATTNTATSLEKLSDTLHHSLIDIYTRLNTADKQLARLEAMHHD